MNTLLGLAADLHEAEATLAAKAREARRLEQEQEALEAITKRFGEKVAESVHLDISGCTVTVEGLKFRAVQHLDCDSYRKYSAVYLLRDCPTCGEEWAVEIYNLAHLHQVVTNQLGYELTPHGYMGPCPKLPTPHPKRDLIAASAMNGLLANPKLIDNHHEIPKWAVELADELIYRLRQPQ